MRSLIAARTNSEEEAKASEEAEAELIGKSTDPKLAVTLKVPQREIKV